MSYTQPFHFQRLKKKKIYNIVITFENLSQFLDCFLISPKELIPEGRLQDNIGGFEILYLKDFPRNAIEASCPHAFPPPLLSHRRTSLQFPLSCPGMAFRPRGTQFSLGEEGGPSQPSHLTKAFSSFRANSSIIIFWKFCIRAVL